MISLYVILFSIAMATTTYGNPVKGVKDCGSTRYLGSSYLTDCDEVPCDIFAKTFTNYQLTFAFKNPYDIIRTNMTFITEDGEFLIRKGNYISGQWTADVYHEFVDQSFIVSSDFVGKSGDLKIEIIGGDNDHREVCVLIGVNIING